MTNDKEVAEILREIFSFNVGFSYFTYPADGTYKTLNAGMLVLDFKKGVAYLPDGTEERISGSLDEELAKGVVNADKCRSYFIDTDKDLRVSLDGKQAYRPVIGNLLTCETYQSFEELHIKILNDNTKLFVFSSTNPRSFTERFMTAIEVSSTGLATEGTINTIKTYIGSSLASGQIRQPFASALASREPYNIRNLTNSDQPGRSWSLTSQEIQTRVENALQAREPYNIRQLTSGDTPGRSWTLSKVNDEAYSVLRTDAGAVYDARDRNWSLVSGDTPGRSWNLSKANDEAYNVLRTDGGVAYDARDRNWSLVSGDVTGTIRKFSSGNLASGLVLSALGTTNELTVDGEAVSLFLKKHLGPASMKVGYELLARDGGIWIEDGEDVFNTDLVVTLNHMIHKLRVRNKLSAASAKVTIDYRVMR